MFSTEKRFTTNLTFDYIYIFLLNYGSLCRPLDREEVLVATLWLLEGVGDDPCVLKKDCSIYKVFTPEQILQLATPTYRDRKNKDKKVSASPTPTHVDPSQVSVLGRVDREKTAKKSETHAGKKKKN